MPSPASIEQFPSLTVAIERSAARKREKLSLTTEWVDVNTVRICADGEVDASNVAQLAEYVFGRIAKCQSLIVDLRLVKFFAVKGFSTLIEIDARCAIANVAWEVVAGGSVRRVLDICDADGALPLSRT